VLAWVARALPRPTYSTCDLGEHLHLAGVNHTHHWPPVQHPVPHAPSWVERTHGICPLFSLPTFLHPIWNAPALFSNPTQALVSLDQHTACPSSWPPRLGHYHIGHTTSHGRFSHLSYLKPHPRPTYLAEHLVPHEALGE
jgi:hypothetical protein